jgi:hypothetical protein
LKRVAVRTFEVLVEGHAIASGSEEIGQRALALLERLLAEIVPIEALDEVEGAEYGGTVMVPIAKEIENRKTRPIDDDRLPVDDAGLDRQCRHGAGDPRKPSREVITIARE